MPLRLLQKELIESPNNPLQQTAAAFVSFRIPSLTGGRRC